MPEVWYCCHCRDGPHSSDTVTKCHCDYQHEKCGNCTTETTQDYAAYAYNHTSTGYGNGNGYGYAAPTDGGEEYRWICCQCGGDNSCALNAGCSDCNNHWRGHGPCHCTVYVVDRGNKQ